MSGFMFIEKMSEERIIIFLVATAYLIRILIAPFHIAIPLIPHDFYEYIGGGKCMEEEKYLFIGCQSFGDIRFRNFSYGPLFATLMWMLYVIFGEYNFLAYKIVFTIFDVVNVVLVYLIAKNMFNKRIALFTSLTYCFFIVTLFNSAVVANDDVIAMMFTLLCTYFLINKKIWLSAVSFSVSILLRTNIIMFFPLFLYYIYRTNDSKISLMYILLTGFSYLVLITPFVFLAGWEQSIFYLFFKTSSSPFYLSPYYVFKLITNINIDYIVNPLLIVSYIVTLILIFIRKMKNPTKELFRNMTLLWIIILLLGPFLNATYTYWFFTPILILLNIKEMTKRQYFGVILIIIGLIIYSMIFRESLIEYTSFDRLLLLVSVFMAPVGTFHLLHGIKRNYRIIYSLIVLGCMMHWSVEAAPLSFLPMENLPNIDISRFTLLNERYGEYMSGGFGVLLSYGIFYGGSAIILWIGLSILYYKILREKST